MASEALLIQGAAASIIGGDDARKLFNDMINTLREQQ